MRIAFSASLISVLAAPVLADLSAPTFTARGHAPDWTLVLDGGGVSLTTSTEASVSFGLPPTEATATGQRFAISPTFTITTERSPCADSRTGMPYPLTVTVEKSGAVLTGCGGDPLEVLAGDWRVTRLDAVEIPPSVEIRLRFEGARLSADAGCNRLTGPVEVTGSGLRFGPVVGTRMACTPAVAEAEAAFLARLARVDRAGLSGTGLLDLTAGDALMIRAARLP